MRLLQRQGPPGRQVFNHFKEIPAFAGNRHMKTYARVLILLTVLALAGCENQHADSHQAEIAKRGTEVMPFDLERTTHVFEKIDTGGRQQVLSDDNDAEQIRLIQGHLKEVAERFSKGDFHDPQQIHGEHMPGLHELVMGHERIQIEYNPLEQGGEILYSTKENDMIEAIHTWFDAQVSDHGHHAQGHP